MIRSRFRSTSISFAVAWSLAGGCFAVLADPIAVANPSFEANVLCDGCISHTIIGWVDTAGGGDGAFNPTTFQYPASAIPDGVNIAYVNNPGNHVTQTLSALLQADTAYTLLVEVGRRLDESFVGYEVQLRAGGVLLASDSSQAPPSGEFRTSTVSFTASPGHPQLGQPLQIRLLSPGVQASFDHVRLSSATVPVELMSFTVD